MRAGKLRHIVTVQQSVAGASDGYGNTRTTWTAVTSNLPASITPITQREVFAGQQIETIATHTIVIRFYPGITEKMRVVFGSRTFNIQSVLDHEELGVMLTLITQEVF